jgi:hypothetical protein
MKSEALVIAQPFYSDWDPLPRAAEAARKLAESLEDHGYALVHRELLDGAEGHSIASAIENWLITITRTLEPSFAPTLLALTNRRTSLCSPLS